jgi:hypothetical protein
MSGTSQVSLHVKDDHAEASPFRADVWNAAGQVKRTWSSDGQAALEIPSGATSIVVRRGITHDAVTIDLNLRPGESIAHEVMLRERFSPRKLGWHGGESHMHVLHGKKDPPRKISDGGRMAQADGLEYLQLAYGWDQSFEWTPAAELNRQCVAASSKHSTIGWNIETPKCYMGPDDGGKSGNLHCFGHGWTVGLKDNSAGRDFFHTGPNYKIIQEVQRQGGIVGCAHPVRSWFNNGNFVSNWASEMPFDFLAGAPYAAMDILNDSPLIFFQSERAWYTLLNLGYKLAGTGNSDGALGVNHGLGRYRTYTHIDGEFSWAKLAHGMKSGACIATSGPFVLFEVDGQIPGAEFRADGRVRRATIKAWSAPLPGEMMHACQLVRNGEVIRAWDLREKKTRYWETEFDLCDNEFAWYCLRVLSTSTDRQTLKNWGPHVYELAVANPVYFLPENFTRPAPEPARIHLVIRNAASQQAMNAWVEVHDNAQLVATYDITGEQTISVPPTATLRFSVDGYRTIERNVYMDCPEIFNFCQNMGTLWPSFYSPETFHVLRQMLRSLRMVVDLSA